MLKQDNQEYEHEIGRSELHIEESGNLLKVYVPRDEDEQDVCFGSLLPRRLLAWLMAAPGEDGPKRIEETAVTIINSILNCRVSAMATILEREGVPGIQIPDVPITSPGRAEEPRMTERISATPATPTSRRISSPHLIGTGSSTPDTSTPRTASSTGYASDYPTPLTDPGDYSDDDSSVQTPVYTRPPPLVPSATQEAQYRRLLERVVSMGRRSEFPNFGATGLTDRVGGSPPSATTADSAGPVSVTYASEWERRMKIGVAGELFVSYFGNPSPQPQNNVERQKY